MLGSWLSSIIHKAAPVAAVAATVVTGNPAVGAAVYSATASKENPNNVANTTVPPTSTTAVNPTGELILGGAAVLALILLLKHPAAAPARGKS